MSPTAPTAASTPRRNLRLWPGVLLAGLALLGRFVLPVVAPAITPWAMMGGLLAALLVLVWWLFLSRAPWGERIVVLVLAVGGLFAAFPFLHPSIAGGMMGMMFGTYALPALAAGLVLWAVATRRWSTGSRWAALLATIVVTCGVWMLLRTDGITGSADSEFAWRWTATPEEKLLARGLDQLAGGTGSEAESTPAWPGFRGAHRDGVAPEARIASDWESRPPVELWRRPVGPGWSSFAVGGALVYTQEQRGDQELVTAYDLTTGEPVWRHQDDTRFWESNAGAGPRGTPTLAGDRLYTFGATGIVNALDARSGRALWSRNAGEDTETEIPGWGFSSSPLVVDDLVVVAAAGALVAYDLADGELRWRGPDGGSGYSSPHLMTLDDERQIVFLSGAGAQGVAIDDGSVLWHHELPRGTRIVQPARTPDGELLVSDGDSQGLRRFAVSHDPTGWSSEERWESIGLKPYFNDFVVHEGHAYGFDGRLLSAVDLASGERRWKGGRFGHGQLLLLPGQDLLVVLTEKGDLALVRAIPERFEEIARSPAIEGKTWNHPALVGDTLLVRNGEEMAAFRLAPAAG